MRAPRYPTGAITAAGIAPGQLVVMPPPDARRCLNIRKM